MAFLLDEDAYEAELIDEFDAPETLLLSLHEAPKQQLPPPFVSAQSVRYQLPVQAHAPVMPAAPRETAMQTANALYPSFYELSDVGASATASQNSSRQDWLAASAAPIVSAQFLPEPSPSPQQQQPVHQYAGYPRVESSSSVTKQVVESSESWHRVEATATVTPPASPDGGEPVKQSPTPVTVVTPVPHAHPQVARSKSSTPAHPVPQQQTEDPVRAETEALPLPMLSQQEFDAKQREIAREVQAYEQQLDYLAHALAGDTPHQKEERKRRELERKEREHQRLVTMEDRVQHQIERAHERELRRAKVLERPHRASRSPSPEMRDEEEVSKQGEEREDMVREDF